MDTSERSPNPDGTFTSAIFTVGADAQKNWNADDVYRRMEFGLKCSYTVAKPSALTSTAQANTELLV